MFGNNSKGLATKNRSPSSSRTQRNFNDKRPKGLKTNAAAFGTLKGALKET